MNSLIVFAAVAVCAVAALPVFEELQESEKVLRHRRSLPEIELEDVPLFHEELMRQARSLSEADWEETPFEAGGYKDIRKALDGFHDEFQRHERSLPNNEFDIQSFQEDFMRQRKSLSQAYLEEICLEGARLKRSTCDELRQWMSPPNHAACAVHCISRGYKCGGYVKNVCKCRK